MNSLANQVQRVTNNAIELNGMKERLQYQIKGTQYDCPGKEPWFNVKA